MVKVNGEARNIAGANLKQFLLDEGYRLSQVVIERNLEILDRDKLDDILIEENDNIEVLNFVSGG